MNSRHLLALLMLLAVVIAPPVAMASDHCEGMGHMCEAPCGASAYATFAAVDSLAPEGASLINVQNQGHLTPSPLASLDPPPKSLALSA